MKRAAWRYAVFVVALAASWFVLLLWAAGSDWLGPPLPQSERILPGSRFRAAFGSALPEQQHLRIRAAAADFTALQVTALPGIAAKDFPLLRYRFTDFPRTLELSLMFRSDEYPDDVQTVSLPWPGEGTSSFDLSRVPTWRGHITELGFAQFATAHNVPPPLGFRPFELHSAQLWSRSWRGDLAALSTDWLGAWPWSQRSVHALGREAKMPARSAVLCAALAALLAVLAAAWILGLRRERLWTAAVVCAALAWVALDLRWQAGLLQRVLATQAVYDATDKGSRDGMVADIDLQKAAEEIRHLIAGEPEDTRILVDAGTGYQWMRLMWHLLPLNVASLVQAAPFTRLIPDGTVFVFYDTDAWHENPLWRDLLDHSVRIYPSAAIMADGFEPSSLAVFRYRHVD